MSGPRASAEATSAAVVRRWPWTAPAALAAMSLGLQAAVAFAGESAAVPGLGATTAHPPYDVALGWSARTVTLLMAVAVVTGCLAVAAALRRVSQGQVLAARAVVTLACLSVAVLMLVPPAGSADHLSYVAYGRIAASGDDPYTVVPAAWRGGADPVAGAVQPPWQSTPSVYGPVTTLAQTMVSFLGADSLRLTVWCWQLLVGACFLATAWLLDQLAAARGPSAAAVDPSAPGRQRTRVAVMWTLNPLLLGQLVLGAHVDVVAVVAAVAALRLLARAPLAAGAAVAVAAGVKAPYALVALALCWGALRLGPRQAVRHIGLGMLGAVLVVVPVHLWSGPHTYDQLKVASRYVSWATPWRLVADRWDPEHGVEAVRAVVAPLALAAFVVLVGVLAFWLVGSRVRVAVTDAVTADAVRACVALSLAWVVAAPYALPWYEAMVWAPASLLAGVGVLDAVLLARLTVLALAYLPGRVVGLTAPVGAFMLHQRRYLAPWLLLAVAGLLVAWAVVTARRGGRLRKG